MMTVSLVDICHAFDDNREMGHLVEFCPAKKTIACGSLSVETPTADGVHVADSTRKTWSSTTPWNSLCSSATGPSQGGTDQNAGGVSLVNPDSLRARVDAPHPTSICSADDIHVQVIDSSTKASSYNVT
ncbi:hypothetical protein PAXRUDRAFT_830244 [Paxillus rubicundulus Ve08.2h10]|uniref:Uncharacterized protein n=1 Tax=Paxillus rubicundulus Ve08.2h10 TaxID=930991 RepID=A0A0D0E4F2_9AGAM|nr:hypothetical protein PAXRUDRAFT_830244 [Paxillus rubicundulus Ve08.2h10]